MFCMGVSGNSGLWESHWLSSRSQRLMVILNNDLHSYVNYVYYLVRGKES